MLFCWFSTALAQGKQFVVHLV